MKLTRDEMAWKESTCDPIFLFQIKDLAACDLAERSWRTDSVWFSRKEAEAHVRSRAYDYGILYQDCRVYCVNAKGKLSEVLDAHEDSRAHEKEGYKTSEKDYVLCPYCDYLYYAPECFLLKHGENVDKYSAIHCKGDHLFFVKKSSNPETSKMGGVWTYEYIYQIRKYRPSGDKLKEKFTRVKGGENES